MYKTLCAPLSAQIEITSLCNNECLHCYNFWRKDRKLTTGCENMSADEIRLIIRKFFDAKIFAITVTGGEPLLNKNGLIICLEEASRLNIEASINSNLVSLDEKYLQDLKKLGVKTFLVSILGPNAEIHDGITQRKGSFDALIKNLTAIKILQEENVSQGLRHSLLQAMEMFVLARTWMFPMAISL